MPLVSLIIYLAAGLIFLAAAFEAVVRRINLVAFGLAVFTAAVIFQFLIHSHIVR